MKLTAVSLLAVTVAALLYYFLGRTEDIGDVLPRDQVPAQVEEDVLANVAELELSIRSEPEREPQAVVEVDSETESKDEATPVAMHGNVAVVNAEGAEFRDLDGVIELLLWRGNRARHLRAAVEGGAFEIEYQDCDSISVQQLILAERGVVIDDKSLRYTPDDWPITVLGHWPEVMRLSVLDSASGAHLNDVRVASGRGLTQIPSASASSAAATKNGSSPMEIQPAASDVGNTTKAYHVHSPGYAWKTIRLDLSQGGERELHLEPGGDLEMTLVGKLPQGDPMFRMRLSGNAGSALFMEEHAAGKNPIEVIGLAVGTYRATVEIGRRWNNPTVFAEIEVEVVAGQRARHELQILEVVEPTEARLAGTVVVPGEWNLNAFRVFAKLAGDFRARAAQPRSKMTVLEGEKDAWSFDLGEIPIGGYNVTLSPGYPAEVEYTVHVKLEAGGSTNVRIELPPPATLVLYLLDASTGDPADIMDISWKPISSSHVRSGQSLRAKRTNNESFFKFRVPIGKVFVSSFASGYDTLREELQVAAGRNEFTVRLDRECPLLILFMDGETPVPATEAGWLKVEHVDGDGKMLYTTHRDSGYRTALSQPGRYIFKMPEFRDFEPIPDQEITVVRGEETRYEVKLVRKR